jgi:hypothetical protein
MVDLSEDYVQFVIENAEKEGHFDFYPERAALWGRLKNGGSICGEILRECRRLKKDLRARGKTYEAAHMTFWREWPGILCLVGDRFGAGMEADCTWTNAQYAAILEIIARYISSLCVIEVVIVTSLNCFSHV